MTIDKAIEQNQKLKAESALFNQADYKKAIQLGIEALIFRLRWEEQEGEDDFPLLPGETKEGE